MSDPLNTSNFAGLSISYSIAMAKVLVACLENWDTLQELPFVLNKGGCTVDVFCSKKSWLISNSYYHNWIECSDDTDTYVKELTELALRKTDAYDWIIPADEKLLNVLNERIHSEELFYRILPLTKIENRDILASKAGLSRICEKYGITSPKYIVYDHKTPFDSHSLQLRYPILLKQDLSWGGGGILFCNNENELQVNLEKANKEYDIIIQEYITGKDIGVEALYRNGELVEYNAGEVTTYFDSKFTFTTKRNYFNSKRLEGELRNIGKHIGINGFASIQFIYQTQEEIYYLLEVDIRPNFWLPSGRFTGHDFSKAVSRFFTPGPLPENAILADENKVTEVAIFYRDIIRVLKRKKIIDLLKWVFNYKGCWKFIPLYDKVLFKRVRKELWDKMKGSFS